VGVKKVLLNLQRERGRGAWSNADPEVLLGGSVVGRLREREAIDEFAAHILERVFGR